MLLSCLTFLFSCFHCERTLWMANNDKSKCTVAQWACHMVLSSDGCHWTSITLHIHANSWKFELKLECWRLKLEFDQNGLWRPIAESSSLLLCPPSILSFSLYFNVFFSSSFLLLPPPFLFHLLVSFLNSFLFYLLCSFAPSLPLPPSLLALTSFSTSALFFPSPLSLAPIFLLYLPSFHSFHSSLFPSPAPSFLPYLLLDFLYHLLNFLSVPSFSSLFIPSRLHPSSFPLPPPHFLLFFPTFLSLPPNFLYTSSSSSSLPHPCILFLRSSFLLYVLCLLLNLPSSYFSSLPPFCLPFPSHFPFCFIVLAPYFLLYLLSCLQTSDFPPFLLCLLLSNPPPLPS